MLLVFFMIIIITIIIATTEIKLYVKIKNNKSKAILKIYILKKILISKIDLSNKRKEYNNNKLRKRINKITKNKYQILINTCKIIKQSKLKIEMFRLKINISTSDVILTSYAVMIISNLITFALKLSDSKIDYKNCKYEVNPIYIEKKVLNIKLNCIISANLVHIIYIIYKNIRNGEMYRWEKNIQ